MTWVSFIGNGLLAYGAPLTAYVYLVGPWPHLVIMSIPSAFAWLMATLISGLLWIAIPAAQSLPQYTMIYSIILQELFRFGYYKLVEYSKDTLDAATPKFPKKFKMFSYSYAAGFGFGLSSAFLMYFDVLVESLGPGTYFFDSCPTVSAPFIMACMNFLGVFLHVTWMVIAFDSLGHGNWRELCWMYLGRFLFSYISLFNSKFTFQNSCFLPIATGAGILLINILYCRKAYKACFKESDRDE